MTMSLTEQRPAGAVDALDVDRLLAEGRALPAVFYTDPEIFELEKRLIFRRSWQAVCSELELRNPGDYVTVDIAGVPVVVVRDKDGGIRGLVNVCRHRGNTIMEGEGHCERMQCGYHGWTYGLDGSLRGAPQKVQGNLPSFATLGLHVVEVDTWGGFVFVSLDPQESLLEQLGELPKLIEETGYDFPFTKPALGLVPQETYDASLRTNWKILVENGHECYHCPAIHATTLCRVAKTEELDIRLAAFGRFGVAAPLVPRDDLKPRLTGKAGTQDLVTVFTFWPNVQVFSGYVGEHILRFEPVATDCVRYTVRSYARPDIPQAELAELVDVVLVQTGAEDVAAVEGTQRGLESGYYQPGPLMEEQEQFIRAFQRNVWDLLRPAFA